jgi:hypothetical protein
MDYVDAITHGCGEIDADCDLFSRILNVQVSDTTGAK